MKKIRKNRIIFMIICALLVMPANVVDAKRVENQGTVQNVSGTDVSVQSTTESSDAKTVYPHTDVSVSYFASYVDTNTLLLKDKITARVSISGDKQSIAKYYGYATPAKIRVKGNEMLQWAEAIAYYEKPVGSLTKEVSNSNTYVDVIGSVQETTFWSTRLY